MSQAIKHVEGYKKEKNVLAYSLPCPGAPCLYIMPTLGPKVCKHYLHRASLDPYTSTQTPSLHFNLHVLFHLILHS